MTSICCARLLIYEICYWISNSPLVACFVSSIFSFCLLFLCVLSCFLFFFFFFFNDTATTEIYTLSLHDALPISTLYFDSLTVNAGNGGFLHCIQMDTSVNAANQVVSVGADIAFDADPK